MYRHVCLAGYVGRVVDASHCTAHAALHSPVSCQDRGIVLRITRLKPAACQLADVMFMCVSQRPFCITWQMLHV
jgi:hypothetical protein